ncbi:hypothetical protein GH714_015377 [Hevea brasiliensis]|uniref:Uncharacterized protein n=1 Tax=Hevea brasiliensis TaxID=3981 RepID=A0A6A6L995_HEVBR|nr:hypothetical protein GH714_015377 [Hevea brasiliensis]
MGNDQGHYGKLAADTVLRPELCSCSKTLLLRIKAQCVHHHCLHSAYLAWCLKTEQVTASPMFRIEMHLPSPAVEILPSKMAHPYKYAGENVELQGLMCSRYGKVSVADIIGFMVLKLYPQNLMVRSMKYWDSSIDLVNVLKHEIRDGQLSFRGKRVLELGCGYGLPGIFACLKGQAEPTAREPSYSIKISSFPSVHFYAGDWEELPTVLSIVRNDAFEVTTGMSQSLSEEDFMDGCSSQDGSIIGQETSSRRSRKLSGSRAWERASETDHGEGGYDVILMTDIPYSVTSLKKLYALIKKCLRPPYGVLYLATKRNYIGFNNGARQLKNLVDEEGFLEPI